MVVVVVVVVELVVVEVPSEVASMRSVLSVRCASTSYPPALHTWSRGSPQVPVVVEQEQDRRSGKRSDSQMAVPKDSQMAVPKGLGLGLGLGRWRGAGAGVACPYSGQD